MQIRIEYNIPTHSCRKNEANPYRSFCSVLRPPPARRGETASVYISFYRHDLRQVDNEINN